MAEPAKLLESSDVARILGLSYSGVRDLVETGKLNAAFVTPRGVRLFYQAVVDALRRRRDREKRRKDAA